MTGSYNYVESREDLFIVAVCYNRTEYGPANYFDTNRYSSQLGCCYTRDCVGNSLGQLGCCYAYDCIWTNLTGCLL